MDTEKLQIQRAFHDLIKELESLRDTTSALETYQSLVQKMSDSMNGFLELSNSNFNRVSTYFDKYKDSCEHFIEQMKSQTEMIRSSQSSNAKIMESLNADIKDFESKLLDISEMQKLEAENNRKIIEKHLVSLENTSTKAKDSLLIEFNEYKNDIFGKTDLIQDQINIMTKNQSVYSKNQKFLLVAVLANIIISIIAIILTCLH